MDAFSTDDGFLQARAFGSVFAAIYGGPVTRHHLESMAEYQTQVLEGLGGYVSLSVITGGAANPDPDTRKAGEEAAARFADRTLASSAALLVDGFHGAALRMMVTTMLILQRLPFPRKVFGTVPDAARWLERQQPGFASNVGDAVQWIGLTATAPQGEPATARES